MGHPPHMLWEPPRAVGVTRRSRRASVERVVVEQQRGLTQQQLAHRVPEPLSYYKKNREARKRREDAFDSEFGRMHAATSVPEPLSYYGKGFTGVEKGYKTARSTEKEWQLPAWKDGALGGGNTQWLKACAEGNYYACGQLEKSNDDIHDVLKPKRKIRPAVKTTARVPKAVFVTQKPSVWGQIMKAIGLGDSYYKNTERTRTVPKMEPDSGIFLLCYMQCCGQARGSCVWRVLILHVPDSVNMSRASGARARRRIQRRHSRRFALGRNQPAMRTLARKCAHHFTPLNNEEIKKKSSRT